MKTLKSTLLTSMSVVISIMALGVSILGLSGCNIDELEIDPSINVNGKTVKMYVHVNDYPVTATSVYAELYLSGFKHLESGLAIGGTGVYQFENNWDDLIASTVDYEVEFISDGSDITCVVDGGVNEDPIYTIQGETSQYDPVSGQTYDGEIIITFNCYEV